MKRGTTTERADVQGYLLEQRFGYEYSSPVRHLRHRLLVVPRLRHGGQRRVGYGHDVAGASGEVTAQTDGHGNTVLLVHAPRVTERIEFTTWTRVVTDPGRPTTAPPVALTDRRWTTPSALTEPDARLRDAAGSIGAVAHADVLDAADRICEWTHDQFTYRFGVTGVTTTASEALAGGVGVCQDYAHVMLAVCRAAGLAARYVSGHLVGEGGSHAWVEVFTPTDDGRAMAVAFDPTHRRRARTGYVTVAVGRDYTDVPPTSGSYHGSCTGRLTAEKRLAVESPALASATG